MALLNRQTEIQEKECDKCEFKAISDPKVCEGCIFAKELVEIGEALKSLSSASARKEGEKQSQKRKTISISIEEYKKGVLENKLDQEIADDLGVNVISLRNWKTRKKITRKMFEQKPIKKSESGIL